MVNLTHTHTHKNNILLIRVGRKKARYNNDVASGSASFISCPEPLNLNPYTTET